MLNRATRLSTARYSELFEPYHQAAFDDIVETLKVALGCTVALVSILDADQQVFAAHVGLSPEWQESGETPLTHILCQRVLDAGKVITIADIAVDEPALSHLVPGDLGTAAYLGAPIKMEDDTVVGVIAAIGNRPREWSAGEVLLIDRFASLARNHVATLVSDRRWSNLFRQLDEGVIRGRALRDADGRVTDWICEDINPAGNFLLDVTRGSGKPISELLAQIEDEWISDVADVVTSGDSRRFTRRMAAVGRWFDGYIQATDGDTFVMVFLDVTDRMNAIEALQKSEEQVRLLVKGAKDYVIIGVDLEHRISSWYGGAEETFGAGEDEMVGRPFAEIFTEEDRSSGIPEKEIEVAATFGVALDRRWHRRHDGRRIYLDGTVRPILADDGTSIRGFIKIARNATMEKQAQDRQFASLGFGDKVRGLNTIPEVVVAAAAMIVGNLGSAVCAGFAAFDPIDETMSVGAEWCLPVGYPISGVHNSRDYGTYVDDLKRGEIVLVHNVETDPRTLSENLFTAHRIRSFVNVPVMEQGILLGVMFILFDKPYELAAEEKDFLRGLSDRIKEAASRIRAEEAQRILNNEISHRLKNSMSMVHAIANQTLRSIKDRGPVDAFISRIVALSKAHEVLLGKDWSTSDIGQIAETVLGQLAGPGRYSTQGDDIQLGPRSTLAVALLLHELGTNALKYGALSGETGTVTVSWSRERTIGDDALLITWVEQGGPPVSPPAGKGFGSKLIRLGITGTGGATIDYDVQGVRVEIRGLISHLSRY